MRGASVCPCEGDRCPRTLLTIPTLIAPPRKVNWKRTTSLRTTKMHNRKKQTRPQNGRDKLWKRKNWKSRKKNFNGKLWWWKYLKFYMCLNWELINMEILILSFKFFACLFISWSVKGYWLKLQYLSKWKNQERGLDFTNWWRSMIVRFCKTS